MHTLFDFISSANGIQYALALLFMMGFVIFCEILKPRPFEGLLRSAAEDIGFIRTEGKVKIFGVLKATILAPFYVLFYVAAVPLLFIHGIAGLFGRIIVATTSIGWSPARAYFTSRRKAKKASVQRTLE
ncbi:MAG TPA: hypothetical protein VMB78_02895 [Dissulfurispiraceae bacterium]|nr:hypothetical protein [Dissulfurispiraceae bacterium]